MCIFKKKKKEKILVEVCNSGFDPDGSHPENARLANEWCLETHTGQYLKDHGPTKVCTKHAKPEPPPQIRKCIRPYHLIHALGVWTPGLLCTAINIDNDVWQEAKLPRLLDAIVEDGPNALRSLAGSLDGTSDWGFYKPWKGQDMKDFDQTYFDVLGRRLQMIKDRDLTLILCLTPYGGTEMVLSPDFMVYVDRMLDFLKPFLPNVIVETMNEPPMWTIPYQADMVSRALARGFPQENIQVPWLDSSDLLAGIVRDQLNGKGLCCLHWYGTMDSINAPHPKGWTGSPGSMKAMLIGAYPSNDGANDGSGLDWSWTTEATRSSPQEIYEVERWSLEHENIHQDHQIQRGRGFEHLSASGFQKLGRPDIEDEIIIGKAERQALGRAMAEVYP